MSNNNITVRDKESVWLNAIQQGISSTINYTYLYSQKKLDGKMYDVFLNSKSGNKESYRVELNINNSEGE